MISKTVYIFDIITENIYLKILCFAMTCYVLAELTTVGTFNIQAWMQEDSFKTALIFISLITYVVTISTRLIKSRRDKEKHKIELGNLARQTESLNNKKMKEALDLRSSEFENEILQEKLRKARLENELLQKQLDNKNQAS